MGVQQNQMKTEPYADGTDSYKKQLFLRRKSRLILCLAILTIMNNFLGSLQEGVEVSRICWLILYLGILLFVMRGTWKAGLLLWVFDAPSAIFYIIGFQELLQPLFSNSLLLSIRIILAIFSSVVAIFTVVWLTLVPKNRRYSERDLK